MFGATAATDKDMSRYSGCTRLSGSAGYLQGHDILECATHGRVQDSFSGEALKRILQNFARDSYQTMNCESGAVSGVRECASGECSKHILIF